MMSSPIMAVVYDKISTKNGTLSLCKTITNALFLIIYLFDFSVSPTYKNTDVILANKAPPDKERIIDITS